MTTEWAVKWEPLGPLPGDIRPKESRQAAEDALKSSMFPGTLVCREVSEWSEAK